MRGTPSGGEDGRWGTRFGFFSLAEDPVVAAVPAVGYVGYLVIVILLLALVWYMMPKKK
jgi:hypothetical protein